MAKSFLNKSSNRGLRNNNPGNLLKTHVPWQGKISPSSDSRFEQFVSLKFGIRAVLKDLIHDMNKGKNTVKLLISEYAPPNENDTLSYIHNVARVVGVSPDDPLKNINAAFLRSMARAIFKVELGAEFHPYVTDTDINEAIASLGNVSTPKLSVNTDINFFFQS